MPVPQVSHLCFPAGIHLGDSRKVGGRLFANVLSAPVAANAHATLDIPNQITPHVYDPVVWVVSWMPTAGLKNGLSHVSAEFNQK